MAALCHAQFSDMTVVGMERVGHVENGPVHGFSKRPWALISLEIADLPTNSINGNKIAPLKQKSIVLPDADDKVYDAYVGAWQYNYAKEITLHHPDFNNCRIVFGDYLDDAQLESGTAYKIKLKLPSTLLIEANTAFNDLDFKKAAGLYSQIISDPKANGEEKIIAAKHLEGIDSLISWHDAAVKLERLAASQQGRERDRSLYRSRAYYKRISTEGDLVKAGLKYEDINRLLGIKKGLNDYNMNTLKLVSAEMDSKSVRAMGNDAVVYTGVDEKNKPQEKKSALFIITAPIKDATVTSGRSVRAAEKKDNDIWLYMKTEIDKKDTNPVLFTISHPDFLPFEFRLDDFDDNSSLAEGTVYRVTLDTPSLIMMMANKRLANLDLDEARALFSYNYADAAEQAYAEKCLGFLTSPKIAPLIPVLDDMVRKCRKTEREYFSIITGVEKFDDPGVRNAERDAVNRRLDSEAAELSSVYQIIFSEANGRGIPLVHAKDMADEYTNIKNGVRRLPLIIEFSEMKDEKGFFRERDYTMPVKISTEPTVLIEILDAKKRPVFKSSKRVKDGQISVNINTAATNFFSRGVGKIRISTPKDMNGGKKPYEDTMLEISNFKISDYSPKKLNVTLLKN